MYMCSDRSNTMKGSQREHSPLYLPRYAREVSRQSAAEVLQIHGSTFYCPYNERAADGFNILQCLENKSDGIILR